VQAFKMKDFSSKRSLLRGTRRRMLLMRMVSSKGTVVMRPDNITVEKTCDRVEAIQL
jgi:hypothetical protein